MQRRHYLATLTSAIAISGCTGGPGDPLITMLGHNKTATSHSLTIWLTLESSLKVVETIDIASEDFEKISDLAWQQGTYRVTVQLDGEPVLAREFHADEHFNQLDVVIAGNQSVELNRATAA